MAIEQVLPFLSAVAVGLIAAFVNRRGQKAETSIEQLKLLQQGQQQRISQLSQDLESTNARLDRTEKTLEEEVSRSRGLWDLSSEAIGFLRKWDYWYDEGQREPRPDVPLARLRERLWDN